MDRQTSFLDCSEPASKKHTWYLYVDGASRSNPGPSGAGIYLTKENDPVEQRGFYLGTKTNNQAEYIALLIGLFYAQQHLAIHDKLIIISDSELLIKQLKGIYAVRNPILSQLYCRVQKRLAHFNFVLTHVLREKNTVADALANKGIDKKVAVPKEILLEL